MLLVFLLSSAGFVAARATEPCPQGTEQKALVLAQEPRGKIPWFAGRYEELLEQAKNTKRIVFLDFYSRSNAYSKKLEKITYNDPRVLAELADLLCYSIDADDRESKPLRKIFQVQNAPALVFLDPDGTLRDQISGYIAAEPFLMELRRIKANKGTYSDLRARIKKDENDLDSRWELACKLRSMGDLLGYETQVSELRERDPEGRSTASRRMRLVLLRMASEEKLELEPLYQFVEQEKEPALLFEGWWALWKLEGQALRAAEDPEDVRRHELRYFAAARALWPLVPADNRGLLGNNIAWSFYENRTRATRSDLEFALSVAVKAVEAAPEVPAVVDTLACCLFAAGQREAALVEVKRCIELDPQNPQWRERLAEFQKAR
jgi:thioredoxin-related protein